QHEDEERQAHRELGKNVVESNCECEVKAVQSQQGVHEPKTSIHYVDFIGCVQVVTGARRKVEEIAISKESVNIRAQQIHRPVCQPARAKDASQVSKPGHRLES